ncbi:multidrug effflux MFS transporter [Rhizorhabdus dicambivorans]|uniref:Bcr/CflA family efflux transporter n=1 Tax=Rhizorhabdus dicambivorans TaxID=1850238 RepID=A0A2A4G246_9SPHN|nr:multidrug effflux MFS transporter [Rhizorhabdus dicambivorans]ATE64828.1 MFS transporter [Rhizorhabdus dicambivorans]PCE44102.1 MFS transporter [Rhizorhabdus dicambivorans]
MNAPDTRVSDRGGHGLPFHEFVALMASLMAVNALGIDVMLPALGRIGNDLGVSVENHQQLVIVAYVGCFGIGQLFYGPLADRYGRRPVLLAAMAIYAIMSFIAAHAASFDLLLAARACQGFSAASSRVLSISIIRDCYSGRRMARVMSLAFMAFLIVPVAAPSLGQLVLLVAPWHWIFYALGAFSLLVGLWAWLRLPETLPPDRRQSIHPRNIGSAATSTLTDRYSLGYTLAGGLLYGSMMGFLTSSRQIFDHSFGAPQFFALGFALVAGAMAVAALLNSHIVERLGMRAVSHGALLGMIVLSLVRLVVLLSGHETLWVFISLHGLTMFLFGLTGSNFGAMAMEPMDRIAGTASSIQGFLSNGVGTAVGLLIGQSFAGSTLPLTLGFLLCTIVSLAIVLIVERGRLFRPHNAPSVQPLP